jgi:hypothetical protein
MPAADTLLREGRGCKQMKEALPTAGFFRRILCKLPGRRAAREKGLDKQEDRNTRMFWWIGMDSAPF